MAVITFTRDMAMLGTICPVAYVVYNSKPVGGSVTPYYWSNRALALPSYFLDPRAKLATITRALSDWTGHYEAASMEFDINDWDQLIAALLEGSTTKYLANREAIIYLTDDTQRRASNADPFIVQRGIVRRVDGQAGRMQRFLCDDYFTAEFAQPSAASAVQVPKRTFDKTHFPVVTYALGSVAAVSTTLDNATNNDLTFTAVTPGVDGISVEYVDPGVETATESVAVAGSAISVTLRSVSGVLSTATQVKAAIDGTPAAAALITVADKSGNNGTGHVMAMSALTLFRLAVGDSGLPDNYVGTPEPIIYGATVTAAVPPAGGGGGGIVTTYGPILPVYAGQELLNFVGENPGTFAYHRFIVAAHPCFSIEECFFAGASEGIYLGNGSIIAPYVPGRASGAWYNGTDSPSWNGRSWYDISGVTTPYRDYNGRRYCVVYVSLDLGQYAQGSGDDSQPITFSVKGIETVGDGTGTLITNPVLQYEHCLRNFMLGDWQTGAWLGTPVSGISGADLMDSSTFTTAATEKSVRGVTYVGAGAIGAEGERVDIGELLGRWNLSADVFSGYDRSGRIVVFNDTLGSPSVTLDEGDVVEGTFSAPIDPDRLANVIPFSYARNAASGTFEIEGLAVKSTSSITANGRILADTRELYFVRDVGTAQDIGRQWLRRQKDAPRRIVLTTGLHGLSMVELGDRITVSHRDGPKASAKYSATVQVARIQPDLDECKVAIEGYDLSAQEQDPAFVVEWLPVSGDSAIRSMAQAQQFAAASLSGCRYMGGSRQFGTSKATYAPVYEYVEVPVQWNLFSTSTVTVTVSAKTTNIATAVKVRIWCVTDNGVAPGGEEQTYNATTNWHPFTFTLTTQAGAGTKSYRIEIAASQEGVDDVFGISSPGLEIA